MKKRELLTCSFISVSIGDLHANPYRNMKHYPINEEKVKALVSSIDQTGFWSNILVRKEGDKIQIAYGHHRLSALKKAYHKDEVVKLPMAKLDDAEMIQIMANENMEEYRTRPSIIDETVKAAKEFLETNRDIAAKYGDLKSINKAASIGGAFIAKFLDWNETKVYHSLERLKLIEEGVISEEAISRLDTEGSARNFVSVVKKRNISIRKQKAIIDRYLAEDTSKKSMEEASIERLSFKKKKDEYEEEKVQELRTYMLLLTHQASEFSEALTRLAQLIRDVGLSPEIMDSDLNTYLLAIQKKITSHLKSYENENKNQPGRKDLKRIAS